MAAATKEELFETVAIPRAVASLSIPTVISSLVMVIYSMVDTYFVGLLNDPVQSAAVALAAPVLLAFNGINNLFGVGSSSMMSRALGRKDGETVRKSSAFGFYGSLVVGLLFALACTVLQIPLLKILGADAATSEATAGYMFWTVTLGTVPAVLNVVMAYMVRAEGASLHASLGTMSGCLINMVLDPICILPWGLNLGAAGAGLATCVANVCAVLYFLIYVVVKRGKTSVCISPKALTLERHIVSGVCTVGIPAAIQNLLNVTGSTLLNNFAAAYGAAALAAMGICTKINMVPMYVAMGISQGIMPLVSYNFASGNHKRMKKSLYFAIQISEVLLVLSALGMFLFSRSLVGVFIQDAQTVAYGSSFLKGFCLAQPVLAFDFLCVGTFQAVGMGKESFILAILRKLIFEIPFLVILNWLFPLYGLPFAQALAEMLMAVIAGMMLLKFFKRTS